MHKFKHPPILVGGKALEYHGVRKAGHDTEDVAILEKKMGWSELAPPTPGFQLGGADYFASIYGYKYIGRD